MMKVNLSEAALVVLCLDGIKEQDWNGRLYMRTEAERMNRKGVQNAVLSRDEMEQNHGEEATFVVRIKHRQWSSWQGEVTWVDQNKTVRFRSALELLKLIDSVKKSDTVFFEDAPDTVQEDI